MWEFLLKLRLKMYVYIIGTFLSICFFSVMLMYFYPEILKLDNFRMTICIIGLYSPMYIIITATSIDYSFKSYAVHIVYNNKVRKEIVPVQAALIMSLYYNFLNYVGLAALAQANISFKLTRKEDYFIHMLGYIGITIITSLTFIIGARIESRKLKILSEKQETSPPAAVGR